MPPSVCRASALSMHCGSSDRLPLVSTIGRSIRRSIRWCSGVFGSMKPSVPTPGATSPATRAVAGAWLEDHDWGGGAAQDVCRLRRRWRTKRARRRDRAPSARTACAAARLRARSRATASALVASQASWNPPSPLMATICPRSSNVAAASTSSSVVIASRRAVGRRRARARRAARRRGRRSAARGSGGRPDRRYSAAQAGQHPNARIVVACAVVGIASMIDRRGPQCVQLVNG